jgi:hypothetical protein
MVKIDSPGWLVNFKQRDRIAILIDDFSQISANGYLLFAQTQGQILEVRVDMKPEGLLTMVS